MTEGARPVEAWRVFALGDLDSALLVPFGDRYWRAQAELLRVYRWETKAKVAQCLARGEHEAPAEDCTCGIRGVQDLAELLAVATSRSFVGSPRTVLEDTGVIAKVTLSGRMLPGTDMPHDDPETTLRAGRVELVELHVGPTHADRTQQVADAYAEVAVFAYADGDWPGSVPDGGRRVAPNPEAKPLQAPVDLERARERGRRSFEAAFVADVARVGFGTKDTSNPESFLPLGKLVCKALRAGVSLNDVNSVLFHTEAEPTFKQMENLRLSAIANLCPDCQYMGDSGEYEHAEPISGRENLSRVFRPFSRLAGR